LRRVGLVDDFDRMGAVRGEHHYFIRGSYLHLVIGGPQMTDSYDARKDSREGGET